MCSLSLNSCQIVYGADIQPTGVPVHNIKKFEEFGWVLDENPPGARKSTDGIAKFDALSHKNLLPTNYSVLNFAIPSVDFRARHWILSYTYVGIICVTSEGDWTKIESKRLPELFISDMPLRRWSVAFFRARIEVWRVQRSKKDKGGAHDIQEKHSMQFFSSPRAVLGTETELKVSKYINPISNMIPKLAEADVGRLRSRCTSVACPWQGIWTLRVRATHHLPFNLGVHSRTEESGTWTWSLLDSGTKATSVAPSIQVP
ncbi:hypothetical protein DFH07DRAFT_1009026 [Mycena maculata]|uniref:Uncharacterized protein n=1 Tax=Mycena maculata TaxID=230809 RepID=A0AAD7HGK5_9AGAR|nr:hypothetical protein DFH07DRAFT_1009026 [Mycena maculata]